MMDSIFNIDEFPLEFHNMRFFLTKHISFIQNSRSLTMNDATSLTTF